MDFTFDCRITSAFLQLNQPLTVIPPIRQESGVILLCAPSSGNKSDGVCEMGRCSGASFLLGLFEKTFQQD